MTTSKIFWLVFAGLFFLPLFSADLRAGGGILENSSKTAFNLGAFAAVGASDTTASQNFDADFGGGLEAYGRFGRWIGAGLHGDYIRLSKLNAHWTRLVFTSDAHLLNEDSKADPFAGAGLGYGRVRGIDTFDISLRAGANIWLNERWGAGLLASIVMNVGNNPDPGATDAFGFGGFIFNAGARYRF